MLRVEIVNAGVGYGQGELLTHAGSANRGYGYTGTPRVYISRPDSADGTQAEAEAAIDNAGRITGITVTKPGSGYKTAPLVTVAAVTPVAQRLMVGAACQRAASLGTSGPGSWSRVRPKRSLISLAKMMRQYPP